MTCQWHDCFTCPYPDCIKPDRQTRNDQERDRLRAKRQAALISELKHAGVFDDSAKEILGLPKQSAPAGGTAKGAIVRTTIKVPR